MLGCTNTAKGIIYVIIHTVRTCEGASRAARAQEDPNSATISISVYQYVIVYQLLKHRAGSSRAPGARNLELSAYHRGGQGTRISVPEQATPSFVGALPLLLRICWVKAEAELIF